MAKKQKKNAKNLATNEDLAKEFAKAANDYYERNRSNREDINDLNEVADYMYACAQNRGLMSSEKSKGMDRDADTRANTGSTIFFRQINTLASQLVQVGRSRPDLFRYITVRNASNSASEDDSQDAADQMNALARWTLKQDEWNVKFPEFAVHAFKYSNVYAMVRQKREYRRRLVKEPVYETVTDPNTGEQSVMVVGEKDTWQNDIVNNHPSITFPHVDMIFLDRYIPNIKDQNCVVCLSLRTRSEIYGDVKDGYFDEESYKKLKEDMQWDGATGSTLKEAEADNRERDWVPSGTDLFLQWDVFMRSPISDDGTWDEENPPELYWGTIVGNTMDGGITMRIERNPDPDDEIPLKEIRVNPDSSDDFYHTTTAEVVRSAYSVDCTLLNMALDNTGNINDPPMTIIDGEHRVKDFTYKKGARWHVNTHDAIRSFTIPDTTHTTVSLRGQVQSEIKQALATDPALMGEYAGSRTSATEFLGVNQNTKNPHMVQISYVLNQLLPWMARKYVSYWYKYGTPQQIAQIADEDKVYEIKPKDVAAKMVHGFDVIVDIVDEYEDDSLRQQQTASIMQIVGSSPMFQQSETHSVDMGELLKVWLEQMKWPAHRIIAPPNGVDAKKVARLENQTMLATGAYDQPQQGENHPVHLREHEAERLRWKGLENVDDPRARNLPLLDQHIAEQRLLSQGTGGQGQAPVPAPSGNETPGEATGNQMAALMGGMQ